MMEVSFSCYTIRVDFEDGRGFKVDVREAEGWVEVVTYYYSFAAYRFISSFSLPLSLSISLLAS